MRQLQNGASHRLRRSQLLAEYLRAIGLVWIDHRAQPATVRPSSAERQAKRTRPG